MTTSETTTGRDLRVVGMTDEQTECDRCGKLELRGTVIIADADGNEHGRYGTTCATRVLNNGTKVTRNYARSTEMVRRQNVVDDLRKARNAFNAGDILGARWWIAHTRKFNGGLVRADERALAAHIENTEGN